MYKEEDTEGSWKQSSDRTDCHFGRE